jgi:hypothetical protein
MALLLEDVAVLDLLEIVGPLTAISSPRFGSKKTWSLELSLQIKRSLAAGSLR